LRWLIASTAGRWLGDPFGTCVVRTGWLPLPARGDRRGGRWYLRYGLSYRDVEELLCERGIEVDHVTVYRWVQTFTPECVDAARPGLAAPPLPRVCLLTPAGR
jgi:hypothetical protein